MKSEKEFLYTYICIYIKKNEACFSTPKTNAILYANYNLIKK